MSKFLDHTEAGFAYHVDGAYVPITKQVSVSISSTYADSRFPDEKRNLLTLNLAPDELDVLIYHLVHIRALVP